MSRWSASMSHLCSAVDVIDRRCPLSPDRIAELLGLCLKSEYFSYGGEFYEQREGAAMGSPVSAVVANLYVEFLEELALESAPSMEAVCG